MRSAPSSSISALIKRPGGGCDRVIRGPGKEFHRLSALSSSNGSGGGVGHNITGEAIEETTA